MYIVLATTGNNNTKFLICIKPATNIKQQQLTF